MKQLLEMSPTSPSYARNSQALSGALQDALILRTKEVLLSAVVLARNRQASGVVHDSLMLPTKEVLLDPLLEARTQQAYSAMQLSLMLPT